MSEAIRSGRETAVIGISAAVIALASAAILSLTPPSTLAAGCVSGTLIKGSLPAVYFCGADGRRYVFPNEKAFKTWYQDFSAVTKIPDADLASILVGGNVTYRPGVRMIKIQSDPKVYAVDRGGVVRPIASEAVAAALYGPTWNKFIDDVSDAFFVNYSIGAPVASAADYDKAAVKNASPDINTDKGFAANPQPDVGPHVSHLSPVNSASGTPLNVKIAVTFSEPIDPASVTPASFSLKNGTTSVTGAIVIYGSTMTFSPYVQTLAPHSVYTASVAAGLKAVDGHVLTDGRTWSFTTGNYLDTDIPVVYNTTPSQGSLSAAVNAAVSLTFNEEMDPATINSSTIFLKQGAASVPGTVAYSGFTATFTPSADLIPGASYTLTVKAGVQDLGGIPMREDFLLRFSTKAPIVYGGGGGGGGGSGSSDNTPPSVLSTNPANSSTGVSVNSTIAVTFSEAIDVTTLNSTNFAVKRGAAPVSGSLTFANATATFTPAASLAADSNFTVTIGTGIRDRSGNSLSAVYAFGFGTGTAPDLTVPTVVSASPANGATGVDVRSAVTVTFSEAMDPATINASTFTLFQFTHQVSGTVTYATNTATFTPSAELVTDSNFTATVKTGVTDIGGNHLAADYSFGFATGGAPDLTIPTVIAQDPSVSAVAVPPNKVITVTFNEAMDPTTINASTFKLAQGATPVAGAVAYSNNVASFTPSSPLASASTTYTVTVTTGVKDAGGNAMAAPYSWNFSSGTSLDTTPPTITATDPTQGETNVPTNRAIDITFSEAMDPTTVTTANVYLYQFTHLISGTVTLSGQTAILKPDADMSGTSGFTATVTTGVRDLAGNALASNFTLNFTTGIGPDTTVPTVVSTSPVDSATGVPVSAAVSATFNESMDPTTLTTSTFTLKQGSTPVAGAVSTSGSTATFTPNASLANGTVYTANLTTGVQDLGGNALASSFSWSFTTSP